MFRLFQHLLLIILFVHFPSVFAHEIRPAIATLEFTQPGEALLEISLNLEAAMTGIGSEHVDTSESPQAKQYDQLRALSPELLEKEFIKVQSLVLQRFQLSNGQTVLPLTFVQVYIPLENNLSLARISNLSLRIDIPRGSRHFIWKTDSGIGNSVIRLKDFDSKKIIQAEYVVNGKVSPRLSTDNVEAKLWYETAYDYILIGFDHIIPKGLDHILFILGLFLLCRKFSTLLWQVTFFTLAHSVTLALSILEIVQVPAIWVEPLIAFSIIYVAIENLFITQLNLFRSFLIILFGLLHGLGFASVLGEIGLVENQFILSLIAFNIGVETGQVTVIIMAYLLFGWAMKKDWYKPWLVNPLSILIAAIAIYWLMERTELLA